MLDYYQLVQGWKEIKNEFNFLATKRNQTVIQRYIRAKFFSSTLTACLWLICRLHRVDAGNKIQ